MRNARSPAPVENGGICGVSGLQLSVGGARQIKVIVRLLDCRLAKPDIGNKCPLLGTDNQNL